LSLQALSDAAGIHRVNLGGYERGIHRRVNTRRINDALDGDA
jgi:hypothetical protein